MTSFPLPELSAIFSVPAYLWAGSVWLCILARPIELKLAGNVRNNTEVLWAVWTIFVDYIVNRSLFSYWVNTIDLHHFVSSWQISSPSIHDFCKCFGWVLLWLSWSSSSPTFLRVFVVWPNTWFAKRQFFFWTTVPMELVHIKKGHRYQSKYEFQIIFSRWTFFVSHFAFFFLTLFPCFVSFGYRSIFGIFSIFFFFCLDSVIDLSLGFVIN